MAITRLQRGRLIVFMVLMAVVGVSIIGVAVGSRFVTTYTTYYAYFEGESLSGLEKGANLDFYGITIGYIDDIKYNTNDLSRLKVTIKAEKDFPVKEDMVVQTFVEGLTGKKGIMLTGGEDSTAKRLPPGAFIPSEKSIMSLVTEQAESLLKEVNTTVGRVNEVIANVDRLTDDSSHVSNILKTSSNITKSVDAIADSLGHISSAVRSTVDNTASITRQIDGAVQKITDEGDIVGVIQTVESTLAAVQDVAEEFSVTAEQSREDISVLTSSLREASVNINILSQKLKDNPSLMLRGNNIKRREID
ncbi:MAG: MlaD family protein [Fibrobacterota bacterium]